MILVPIVVKHGVDTLRRHGSNMLFDSCNQLIEVLVKPGIRIGMLNDVLDAERGERGASLGAPVQGCSGAVAAIAQNHRGNLDILSDELGQSCPAAQFEIVRMCAKRQDGLQLVHDRYFSPRRLKEALWFASLRRPMWHAQSE
jgi:hypothetical protein